MSFNESGARKFYQWLSHKPSEFTEIRIIAWPPGSALVIQRWVQNEDAFIELCREWSGKRQCYVGINPRKREGGSKEDVSRVTAIPFDVDSKHPTDEAATDEELAQAQNRVIELNSWIRTQGYKAPLIVMSGNGYHVLQKVDIPIDEDLPSILEKKLEAYFHEAPTEGMDSIFDLPRIIKIPGTMSVKGPDTNERPHRLSYILTEGDPDVDTALGRHITELEPYIPTAKIYVPTLTATPEAKTERRTGNLKPCFKRFAEEGGRLTSIGSEDHLLRLALVVEAHAKGYSRAQILELFTKAEDFDPKTTRDKVDNQLGKIAVDGLKAWSCQAIHKHGGCLGETCNRYKKQVAKYLPTPPPDPGQPASPDAFFDANNSFIPTYLVNYIIETTGEGHLLTPTTKKGGDVTWRYHPRLGIFRPDGVTYVEKEAKHILGDKAKKYMLAEVVKLMQVETYIDREEFEEDPDILVLKNGVYNFDTEEVTEHSPQYHAKARLPITYDSDAKAPAILKFLEEVIPGKVTLFLEWLGYHLIKDYRWADILILVGDGENGKSVLLRLMRTFLGGTENVSDVSLLRLTTNNFAASRLYGKLANIAADVGSEELKDTSQLKTLTGNDWFEAEAKYQEGFSMLNYAKLSFSTNKVPKTLDRSRAFHRRPLIITCPNFFVKGVNRDPDIFSKITTPQELSGLFNLALEGRARLLKNGEFTGEQTVEEKQELYEELMDDVTAFINHCVETADIDGVIPKDDFHMLYYQFCKMKGYAPALKGTFSVEIKPRVVNLGEGQRRIEGKRVHCWTGISMKPDKTRVGCAKCAGYINCKTQMYLKPAQAAQAAQASQPALYQKSKTVVEREIEDPVPPVPPVPEDEKKPENGFFSPPSEPLAKPSPEQTLRTNVEERPLIEGSLEFPQKRDILNADKRAISLIETAFSCADCGAPNATIRFRNMNLCPACMRARMKGGDRKG